MTSFLKSGPARPVAIWLFVVAAMVFAMVILGGSTRLTNSGVSITEWQLVTGTLPPLNVEQWMREFDNYQQTAQYRLLNQGMSLAEFKVIFWWEWSHRLLGRLVGLAAFFPLVWFMWRRTIPARLIWRGWLLVVMVGIQGGVGIWMVKSGLVTRTEVAPERLTLHLGLALICFSFAIWTGLEAWAGPKRPAERPGWPVAASVLVMLVFLQILLGGLVAGNRAGLVHADWPLYSGKLWPEDYSDGSLWHSLLHSMAAVQANHRMVAYILLLAAWIVAGRALASRYLPRPVAGLSLALAVLVTVQALLGIGTLMMGVPLPLALAHQTVAALVLALALGLAWRSQRP